MEANGQIVRRQAELLRDGSRRLPLQIDASNHLGISRTKSGKQLLETGADRRSEFVQRRGFVFSCGHEFLQERLSFSGVRRMGPVVIDHGVPEDTVEPCHGAVAVLNRMLLLDRPHEALLEQILSQGVVPHPPAEKGPEHRLVREQLAENVLQTGTVS